MDPNRDVEVLNDLIAVCFDSAQAYAGAADRAGTPTLRSLLRTRATERQMIALDLQNQVRQRGHFPIDRSMLDSRRHRSLTDMEATAMHEKDSAIAAAERTDDAVRACFEKALTGDISAALRQTINSHFRCLGAGHDQAGTLRQAAE